jgi:hypothetical protein
MGKTVKKLSARAVATIVQPGRHSDGDGLYLNVTRSGTRSWLFMWRKNGKRREMGLGSAGRVSLARARELAGKCRAQVAAGLDPIEAREAAAEVKPEKPTFGAIADALIAAKKSEWRNEKHLAQWRASLTEFAAPLRSRQIDEIDTAAVLAVLTPLWQTRPETASRLRGRIEAVLDAAKAQGHRSGENPAGHGAATSRTSCRSAGSSHAAILRLCPMPRCRPSWRPCASEKPWPHWRSNLRS